MRLPGLHRQRSIHKRTHRELIDEPAINTDDRYDPTVPAGHDRLAQGNRAIRLRHHRLLSAIIDADRAGRVRLHADSIDHCVWATATGHLLERVVKVYLLVI